MSIRPGTLLRIKCLYPILMEIIDQAGDLSRICDFGGHDGELLRCMLQHKAISAYVLDIDIFAIRIARERGVSGVRADAEFAPFHQESFDLLLCLDLIEHVEDYTIILSEIARVLRKGGLALITAPCENFSLPLISRDWLNSCWGHVHNGFSLYELQAELEANGLSLVKSGLYFNFFSRLAYSMLFFLHLPPLPSAIRMRIFGSICDYDRLLHLRSLEHWIMVSKSR